MVKKTEIPKKEVKKAVIKIDMEGYRTEMEIETELEKEQDRKLGRL